MNIAKAPDWIAIEADYRAGVKTLRAIGDEHGISHAAINKRAKRDGWERGIDSRIIEKVKKVKVVPIVDEADRAGFVYVIYLDDSSDRRFYKIGMASSFPVRLATHQCASPFDICVACAYFVPNMRAEERYLHQLFADKHVRGEWFALEREDLLSVSKRAVLV